ncbi:PCI-domain-containing protein [Gautieria morchelliformis]|nr:PCI-domain-containing protein [Gautieria morchelliformis]
MSDDVVLPIPNFDLTQFAFILSTPSLTHLHDHARTELLKGIQKDQMAPYYRYITSTSDPSTSTSLPTNTTAPLLFDARLHEEMASQNKDELDKLDARLAEAEKTEGESEIADALRAKATYLTRIGDKENGLSALALALDKTPGLGSKIDLVLTLVRVGFFFSNEQIIKDNLTKADELIEKGGDWDRRNRLKVYQALHTLSIRQFHRATPLLLDSLSTFTATELLPYDKLVLYAVVAGTLSLGRVEMKKKILQSPEVNSVLHEIKDLSDFTKSLYECHYDKFFIALASLEQAHLLPSQILRPHARWYVREMRIRAYAQLLESYSSLTLKSMSAAFGVKEAFVDNDLSHFISSGRLNCSIDQVHGIVETTRASMKAAQYETVIKRGDVLLGSLQKLSKVLY